jgi:DNA excision repair protein ERCC-5
MDPYRLPEASMPTVSTEEKPDARLATEAELKQFIDEVHPEDIDIESPEFRALPTEVQYEIVGDMRVRSRQTSHKRLADMLRAAPSALDFSMAQIKNLSQRNSLTQQLFTVTDSVGQAHLKIPVRIAAERNREYVLVKRDETQGGGWALGIREGSKQKPIEVEDEKPARLMEDDTDSDYSDGDIAEVAPPPQPSRQTTDPDLREHRRREVLEAIAARYAPKKAPRASLDIEPKSFGKARLPGAMPLFEATDDDIEPEVVPSANDEALALALQQEELGSDEEEADLDLARALAISRKEADGRAVSVESIRSATSEDSFEEVSLAPSQIPTPQGLSAQPTPIEIEDDDEDEDMEEVVAPLPITSSSAEVDKPAITDPPPIPDETTSNPSQMLDQRSHVPPSKSTVPVSVDQPHHVVSSPTDLTEVDRKLEAQIKKAEQPVHAAPITQPGPVAADQPIVVEDAEEDDFEIIADPTKPVTIPSNAAKNRKEPSTTTGSSKTRQESSEGIPKNMRTGGSAPMPPRPASAQQPSSEADAGTSRPPLPRSLSRVSHRASPALSRASSARSISRTPAPVDEDPDNLTNSLLGIRPTRPVDRHSYMEMAEESVPSSHQGSVYDGENGDDSNEEDEDKEEDEDDQIEWSKSPSPGPVSRPPLQTAHSGETIPSEVEDNEEDMAPAEMVAEQDDYARFMASIRNRDLNEVRGEIDDEIRVLNNQNKVAMRDSDEITQAMVAQIQVCHLLRRRRFKLISRRYYGTMVYHTSQHPWKPKLNVPNSPNWA